MGQFARQTKHRRQVHLQDRVPVRVGHPHEKAVLGDAGIVDEGVDAFELGLGLLSERLHLVAVREVGGKDLDAITEFGGERFELLLPRSMQADRRALPVESPCDRFADTAGSAGDEGLSPAEIKHLHLLRFSR